MNARRPARGSNRDSWAKRYQEELRFCRGIIFAGLGMWMLVHETLAHNGGRPLVIGAALVLCGLEPALRLDQWVRGRSASGNGRNGGH